MVKLRFSCIIIFQSRFSSLLNLVLLLVVGMLVISWLKFLMANKSNKIASFMEQFLGICIYIRLQLRTWALGELRIDAQVPVFWTNLLASTLELLGLQMGLYKYLNKLYRILRSVCWNLIFTISEDGNLKEANRCPTHLLHVRRLQFSSLGWLLAHS